MTSSAREQTGGTMHSAERDALEDSLSKLSRYRHDAILNAVALSAKTLLRSHDLKQSFVEVLAHIGTAAAVDRVHLFQTDPENRAAGATIAHYCWNAPGVTMPDEMHDITDQSLLDAGLADWIGRLRRGEVIVTESNKIRGPARGFLKRTGVGAVAVVPIFADGEWWGQLGFDDRQPRNWTSAEIDTLRTLAEIIGAAAERAERIQTLADAKRIIEESPTVLFRLEPKPPYALTYISENIRRYGYEAEALLAEPTKWAELIDPADHAVMQGDIRRMTEGKQDHVQSDLRLIRADGERVWLDGEGRALRDRDGTPVGIEGVLSDITERKRAEKELSFSHVLLTTALECSPDAVLVVDENGNIVAFNQNFVSLWEVPKNLLDRKHDPAVLDWGARQAKDPDAFLARVRYHYDNPELRSHEEVELKDGRILDRHSGALHDAEHNYLGRVWFFRDITEKRRAAQKIEALARSDALTELANRGAFVERLKLEFARAKRQGNSFALLYLDLDHFKDVNDTLGHPVGDALLKAVAERLRNCVRETDLVARLGGDEFVIVQDNPPELESVETLAAKIGSVLAEPYKIEGNRIDISASIGIVPYQGDIESPEMMMTKADLALYRAKKEGGNQYRFHAAELDREVWKRLDTGRDLRRALDQHEFELFYQPQVELATGRIVGLEALIRWNHPSRGLVLPNAFIPIAETTGSIDAIGRWCIGEACQQIRHWEDLGLTPPTISVNLSAAQFKLTSDLHKTIAAALKRYGLRPRQLELELAETVLVETAKKHKAALKRLREIGVQIAIDDFGTGYSSLNYLLNFQVARLKIDRSFIAEVTSNPNAATIVRAVIGLARELDLEVVAEGAETKEQCIFLAEAGCTVVQSNFFSPPVPAAKAAEMLHRTPCFSPLRAPIPA
ncbi:EAL domain-containing protein [Methyloligella sp. 2.7D]|uniref:bifunctional diguanylate cyclase/phosphodiesterase n=1 Tax=unclassified Methyloligella TaxID=2625955 RepID=UPI00157C3FA0|nr:EAL domain-containing protein [Methyloligella sp. GL2]QKP75979.1 EAL domain-containing protein [Methyloligella sp. GL2]